MKKGLVITLIIITFIGLLVYNIAGTVHIMNVAGKIDSVTTVSNAPKQYLNLFTESKKLMFDETVVSKTRNPITKFDYDRKFRVEVYRIKVQPSISLKDIYESHKNDHITYHHTFHVLDDFDTYSVSYKSGTQDVAKSIYLNLCGDGTFTIKKNDSIAYYYSRARNFYIKFQKDGVQDFFVGPDDDWHQPVIPMEIMLMRRADQLYLVLLVPEKKSYFLAPGTLLTLIKK